MNGKAELKRFLFLLGSRHQMPRKGQSLNQTRQLNCTSNLLPVTYTFTHPVLKAPNFLISCHLWQGKKEKWHHLWIPGKVCVPVAIINHSGRKTYSTAPKTNKPLQRHWPILFMNISAVLLQPPVIKPKSWSVLLNTDRVTSSFHNSVKLSATAAHLVEKELHHTRFQQPRDCYDMTVLHKAMSNLHTLFYFFWVTQ